jgi:hypothetical protein
MDRFGYKSVGPSATWEQLRRSKLTSLVLVVFSLLASLLAGYLTYVSDLSNLSGERGKGELCYDKLVSRFWYADCDSATSLFFG